MESDFSFPPKKLNLEAFVDDFVERSGGKRVTEILGESPTHPNADYFYEMQELVMELKILESTFISEEDLEKQTDKILGDKCTKKKVKQTALEEFQEYFHRELSESSLNLARKRLGRVVEKANKQIKYTKKEADWADKSGVLLIINDNFTKFSHEAIFRIICNILTQRYSSIDCFIYTTINLWSDDGTDIVKLPWLTAYGENANDDLAEKIDSLGREFFRYLAEHDIVQIEHHIELDSLQDLPKLKHIPLD